VNLPGGWLCTEVAVVGQQLILIDLRLNAITAADDLAPMPLTLFSATPNPFNPTTKIKFSLDTERVVDLRIFNARGRLVRSLLTGERLGSGPAYVTWDGREDSGRLAASGVYFCRLETGTEAMVTKLTMLK